jgi:hypothetical protein
MKEGGWMDERRYELEAGVEEGEEKGEEKEKEKEEWELWGVKLIQVV